MIGRLCKALGAAGLAAALLLPAGGALADECGKSHRAAPPSCVTWWYEGSYPYKRAYAKNNCQGEMVLKIDIKKGDDDRWHMDYGEERRETYGKVIRDVRCCTRMGDGCDQETMTSTSCEDNYRQSSAAQTCRFETFSQSGLRCTIGAECGTGQTVMRSVCNGGRCSYQEVEVTTPVAVTVKIVEAGDLNNCSGDLTTDSC